VSFRALAVDICEAPMENESPETYTARLALEKANAGLALAGSDSVVLGADTTVVQGGQMLGKPTDKEDAARMLQSLSASSHKVISAVALVDSNQQFQRLCETTVWFRTISEAEILRYWQTGEPRDKAGGYGIQGKGAVFVEKISGSYSNVVGLPLLETCQLLAQFNIPWWEK
jgi:septum formation protein